MNQKQNIYDTEFVSDGGYIITLQGHKLYVADPKPDQIDIKDIAQGLAYQYHFGAFTDPVITIAQHCLLVWWEVQNEGGNTMEQLVALLHDAPEAYLKDMLKPIKNLLQDYQALERKYESVIFSKFGLDTTEIKNIKWADKKILELEWQLFTINPKQYGWGVHEINQELQQYGMKVMHPYDAYKDFLLAFDLLSSHIAFDKDEIKDNNHG